MRGITHVDTRGEGIEAGGVHLIAVSHGQVAEAGPVLLAECLVGGGGGGGG